MTPTIKALHLALDKSIHFQAGQYVQLEIPGLGQARAFSIANSPADVEKAGEIELNVRIVAGGAGTRLPAPHVEGRGSAALCPAPTAASSCASPRPQPMIFMAGGSGLSSPRSMILNLLDGGCTLPITLVYGQRSRAELYYDDEFRALADTHPNFTYVPVLSNEPRIRIGVGRAASCTTPPRRTSAAALFMLLCKFFRSTARRLGRLSRSGRSGNRSPMAAHRELRQQKDRGTADHRPHPRIPTIMRRYP